MSITIKKPNPRPQCRIDELVRGDTFMLDGDPCLVMSDLDGCILYHMSLDTSMILDIVDKSDLVQLIDIEMAVKR